tara:strand:- start:2525 stop:3049 length:525 start_codon:yes stop_codon:yes gene_type:complete
MTHLTSKICIVGDFAVGKTSVIERFVNNEFSDKYLSTVGVKIDTKEISHRDIGIDHKLVIWDVAGSDRFDHREFAYLRGANGLVFVADGTRPRTVDTVRNLQQQIFEKNGSTPSVFLVNKRDLVSDWSVDEKQISSVPVSEDSVFMTSAKTGDAVEQALLHLAEMIIAEDIRGD